MSLRSISGGTVVILVAMLQPPNTVLAQTTGETSEVPLPEITVEAARVANTRPASTYATAATVLRFDPLTELQSRGLAEGQSDVTVRGSMFENTGFMLGASTIMDPQTGHYVAELPVDPAFMTAPHIAKGIDNSIRGFNSNIATVAYALQTINTEGLVEIGAGTDALNFQSVRAAHAIITSNGSSIGGAVSFARSEGDGTLPNGDHDFSRFNLHLQHAGSATQTDLVLAHQEKFYGWPGAYTGFATLPETDDTETDLLYLGHRREQGLGWFEISGFYRRLDNDYDFDRRTVETGVPGSFEHETRVHGIGIQGARENGRVEWRYGAQYTADELIRSTDLTNGFFTKRRYFTASIVPQIEWQLANESLLQLRAGVTYDSSDQDSDVVLPLIGFTYSHAGANSTSSIALDFASSSQVPGYTALNSGSSGLFGGNPLLGRERADQVSLTVTRSTNDWQASAAIFYRRDEDLVDWTFSTASPFARQANAVDIDVAGAEGILSRRWDQFDIAAGYTYLDKDADYGSALVDASFYALNFARHRATLAIRYRIGNSIELRLDNEYRVQRDNPLRASSSEVYLGSFAVAWEPVDNGFSARLTADNFTDSDFQSFPGTPGFGRQISIGVAYSW